MWIPPVGVSAPPISVHVDRRESSRQDSAAEMSSIGAGVLPRHYAAE